MSVPSLRFRRRTLRELLGAGMMSGQHSGRLTTLTGEYGPFTWAGKKINDWVQAGRGMPGVLEPETIEALTASAYDAGAQIVLTQASFVLNSGSAHGGGGTVDIGLAGRDEDYITRITASLRKYGFAVYRPGPHSPGYTGPHLHAVLQTIGTLNPQGRAQADRQQTLVTT